MMVQTRVPKGDPTSKGGQFTSQNRDDPGQLTLGETERPYSVTKNTLMGVSELQMNGGLCFINEGQSDEAVAAIDRMLVGRQNYAAIGEGYADLVLEKDGEGFSVTAGHGEKTVLSRDQFVELRDELSK